MNRSVGFWALDWQSANLNYDIIRLLTEEKLGYSTLETGRSPTVQSGMWAIVGCREPYSLLSEAQQNCSFSNSTTHVTVETWDFYLPTTLEDMETLPDRKPINLGSLGFAGLSVNWVPRDVFLEGMKDRVLLDHYRFYNDSVYEPAKYFDSLDDINTTEFYSSASRCKDYPPMNEEFEVNRYLKHYNDLDGVEYYTENGTTKVRGRCDDGVWWLSPACRRNRTRCIPYITVWGYGYTVIWHKAVEFNMAIALASTPNWVDVIYDNTVLNYAWVPDANFAQRGLMQVMFPGYNKDQHDNGSYISEFASVVTEKWAHRGLEQAAPRLWATLRNMQIPRTKMNEMLELRVRQGLTSRETACEFLRNNKDLWEKWITSCSPGQGLNVQGSEGKCERCPPAKVSDDNSTTPGPRNCVDCVAGKYQTLGGQMACLLCDKGTHTSEGGKTSCTNCINGWFADTEGSSVCQTCPPGKSTLIQGARDISDCYCNAGSYDDPADNTKCIPCTDEMVCPVNTQIPTAKPSFYVDEHDWTKVYKCRNDRECPGGKFGTCGPNRGMEPSEISDSTGLVCAACNATYFETFSGDCKKCSDIELSYALIPFLQIIIAPFLCGLIYFLSKDAFTSEYMDAPPRKIGTLAALVLVQMQTIGVINQMTLNFPALAISAWEFGDWLNQPMQIFNPACAGGGSLNDFPTQYAIRSIQPVAVCFFFFVTYCLSRLLSNYVTKCTPKEDDGNQPRVVRILRHRMLWPQTFNACGGTLFTFCIAVFQLSLELFQCYSHPRGDMASMVKAPEVLCYSAQWEALIIIGVITVILYGIVPMVVFTYVLCVAPMYFHGRRFRATWKFLLMKWKPAGWWWSVPFLIKGFLLSMTSVLFEAANYQVMWVACVQLLYLYCLMQFLPWRHIECQRSDAFFTFFLVLVSACCFVWATKASEDESEEFAKFAMPFSFFPMAFVAVQGIFASRSAWNFVSGQGESPLINGMQSCFHSYHQLTVLADASMLDLVQATVHSTPQDRQYLADVLATYSSEVILTHRGSGVANLPRQPLHRLVQRRASGWLREQLTKTGQPITTGDRHFKDMMTRDIRREDLFGEADKVTVEAFSSAWISEGGSRCLGYAIDLFDPYGHGIITRAAYDTVKEGCVSIKRQDNAPLRNFATVASGEQPRELSRDQSGDQPGDQPGGQPRPKPRPPARRIDV